MNIIKFAAMTPETPHGTPLYNFAELGSKDVKLHIAVMNPGDTQERETPADHVMVILEGKVRLTDGDGNATVLEPWDAINFLGGEFRKMENVFDKECKFLLIDNGTPHGAPGGPGGPHK